jgi:hypothetical protein
MTDRIDGDASTKRGKVNVLRKNRILGSHSPPIESEEISPTPELETFSHSRTDSRTLNHTRTDAGADT